MQYAFLELENNCKVIIDANELKELNNLKEKSGTDFDELEPKNEDLKIKLVYGAIIPQYRYSKDKIKENLESSIGKALGYIKDGTCILIELIDIETFDIEDFRRIPFAAIINTNLDIDNDKSQALSTFLRYSNMSAVDNIFNRFGILAIKEQENRIKEKLSKDNWKDFIDNKRATQAAKKTF